jgi:hypothetical protein
VIRHDEKEEGRVAGMLTVHAGSSQSTPDWSTDRFLTGSWSCDLARPGRQVAHERAVYSMGLEGRRLKLTYTATTEARDAPDVATEAYESYDAVEMPSNTPRVVGENMKVWKRVCGRRKVLVGMNAGDHPLPGTQAQETRRAHRRGPRAAGESR